MPLILRDCDVFIDGESLKCVCEHLELNPDTQLTTVTTFCGETDYPGIVKWSLTATFVQSFDAGATEDILSAAVEGGVPVPFQIVPYGSQPISATNPAWSGEVIPQDYSPINGDAGEASTIDIEWSLVGPPVKTIVPV
jgi:hypothetical protein